MPSRDPIGPAEGSNSVDTVNREDRRFSVSSNRGRAKHRIHYVESDGALVDNEECAFCQSSPELGSFPEKKNERAGRASNNRSPDTTEQGEVH